MLSRWQSTIVDEQGNVQPFAILTVLNEATQTPAQIYASESESQPLPVGSVVADEFGYAYFYAHGGRYRIQSTDLNIDWRHVPLGTAATRDVGTGSGTVAAGDDSRIVGAAQTSSLGTAAFADIVGTVSQSGGLPSGAIVQAGYNASVLGHYARWADGTQITFQPFTVGPIAPNDSALAYHTYPIGFAALPEMVLSVSSGAPNLYSASAVKESNGYGSVYAHNGFTSSASVVGSLISVGRWFL